MPLPWLLTFGGYHGFGNMHMGMPWPWLRAHRGYHGPSCLPIGWLFSQIRVFQKGGYFPKVGYLGRATMRLVNVHGGRLDLCCLPVRDALALATCHSHGSLAHRCCFPMEVVMALEACIWACHGLQRMPMLHWPSLAHWMVIF